MDQIWGSFGHSSTTDNTTLQLVGSSGQRNTADNVTMLAGVNGGRKKGLTACFKPCQKVS